MDNTGSIRNTNQESSDVSTSYNIGSNKWSSDAHSNSLTKKKGAWTRQYFENYIQFGFIEGDDNKPFCVITFKRVHEAFKVEEAFRIEASQIQRKAYTFFH
ncbi:zinc finger BED domain-containing protein 5-like [Aphis craccivora]|uniref:Zinc finger BED domain-containing protein 5-like n=1 Tax=Aphis craccivora TaxID=307492 RepID=A0A6G0XRI7_APHCR|nr:zinc finger BED domain-containing protein 5-like [Aphis craccivora]